MDKQDTPKEGEKTLYGQTEASPRETKPTEERLARLEQDMARVVARFEKAQKWLEMDAEVSLGQARKAAEAICKQIYINEGREKGSKPASKMMLNDLISQLSREKLIPQRIGVALGTIQAFGNLGVHDQGEESDHITADTATPCLHALSTVVTWYTTEYHKLNFSGNRQSKKDEAATPDFQAETAGSQFRMIVEVALSDGHITHNEQELLQKKWRDCGISQKQAWDILVQEMEKLPSCTMDAPANPSYELFVALYNSLYDGIVEESLQGSLSPDELNLASEEVKGVDQSSSDSERSAKAQKDEVSTGAIAVFYVAGAILPLIGYGGAIYLRVKARVRNSIGVALLSTLSCFAWALILTELYKGEQDNAEAVDGDALYQTALNFLSGSNGVEKDHIKGMTSLSQVAEQGNAKAQALLGLFNQTEGDSREAVKWFIKAAEQGNVDAQVFLAMNYLSGEGITKDESEAAKWLQKAAEQGNAVAQYILGTKYYDGEGVSKDTIEALKYLKAALQQGPEAFSIFEDVGVFVPDLSSFLPYELVSSKAQLILGGIYYNGEGVPRARGEAVKWFRMAAEQGDAQAQFNLGAAYYNGEGIPKDYKEAVKWFGMAAEQEHADAQSKLGLLLNTGVGVPMDSDEAVQRYSKAAAGGDTNAMIALGSMYCKGVGIPKDAKEAVRWYRKAAEQGIPIAQFNLGTMYYSGEGIPKDHKEAVQWFSKAAEQGISQAQFNLGAMYYSGKGIPKDHKEAVKWYRKAAEQGYTDAQSTLGTILYTGKAVPMHSKEAVKWFSKAAEQGDVISQFNLGAAYYNGVGVSKSLVYAYAWLMVATSSGHNSAKETMESFKSAMTPDQILMAKELSQSLVKTSR
jgi:TPR repeat protein